MTAKFWIGDSGNWSTPYNWSPSSVPSPGDLVIDETGQITATNVGIDGSTVWLDYDQYTPVGLSLINSSLGPTSDLVTSANLGDIEVKLHNSALQGSIFDSGGPAIMTVDAGTSAVNYGWWGIASDTALPARTTLIANGAFANVGVIEAGVNGSFDLSFGHNPAAGVQYTGNFGIIQADPGSGVGIDALTQGVTSNGVFVNYGIMNVNSASMAISADLLQSQAGIINVTNNGSLTLAGKSDGGTIQIESGSLNFPDTPAFLGSPFSSTVFNSTLDLTGSSATLNFGSEPIHEEFLAATNELAVTTIFNGRLLSVADIHLAGAAAYSAADFSTSGSVLTYSAGHSS